MIKTSDFDYYLPQELIAQSPLSDRDACKMLYLNKSTGEIKDNHFFDIVDYLNKDDILILNDTKVYPARIIAKRMTGAEVEVFLLNPYDNSNHWEALTKNAKRVKKDEILEVSSDFKIKLIEKKEANKENEIPKYIVELIYDNNENIEIYLDDNNNIKGTTIDGLTDISVFEKEKEVLNLNFKIDENSIDFNIDTPNAKDYLGISFKQNNEIINENEIKYDQNIIFYFGNETNPYSIELINNATIYNNTDININNTQNYVEVEQLTEDDIITILTNLQNQIEGTVFQSLFELFIKSTY